MVAPGDRITLVNYDGGVTRALIDTVHVGTVSTRFTANTRAPAKYDLRLGDEGSIWIRGWWSFRTIKAQALLAAYALAKGVADAAGPTGIKGHTGPQGPPGVPARSLSP